MLKPDDLHSKGAGDWTKRDGEETPRSGVCWEEGFPSHFLDLRFMGLEEIKEHQLEAATLKEALSSKDSQVSLKDEELEAPLGKRLGFEGSWQVSTFAQVEGFRSEEMREGSRGDGV